MQGDRERELLWLRWQRRRERETRGLDVASVVLGVVAFALFGAMILHAGACGRLAAAVLG